jgi:DNA-binding transcriptional MerR regulator
MRTENRYREYDRTAVDRVLLIRAALALGFRLNDLADILKSRDAGRLPCRRVREVASEKLSAVEAQIAELKKLRAHLQHVIETWNERLENAQPGKPAHLLESLTGRKS